MSILTFQAPYNFHLLFLNSFDLFFGFNLNANISPYSKEWTDEEEIPTDDQGNTQVLKREEDITGGLSLGYQYGLNIFYKEWFVQFKQRIKFRLFIQEIWKTLSMTRDSFGCITELLRRNLYSVRKR